MPNDVRYQGRLTDSVGAPLTGPVHIELRIYGILFGGDPLYAEGHAGVALDDDGRFGLLLGLGTPMAGAFDTSLFEGVNRYLEVVIDGDVLSPRLPISSVPYAMVAEEASAVQGAPNLVSDVQALQTEVGSLPPGAPSVVDQLTNQAVTIGSNTVAVTLAQASADSASTAAAAAQATADDTDAALATLQAALPSLQDLSGQDLSGQDLSGQNLSMANLQGAILVGANLQGANLFSANLSGANLDGADLRSANLNRATLLDATLLDVTIGDSGGGPTSMIGANVSMTGPVLSPRLAAKPSGSRIPFATRRCWPESAWWPMGRDSATDTSPPRHGRACARRGRALAVRKTSGAANNRTSPEVISQGRLASKPLLYRTEPASHQDRISWEAASPRLADQGAL